MRRFRHFFFVLLILSSAQSLLAQNVSCEATLDRYSMRIGERCTLRLAVRYTEGTAKAKVMWPLVDDSTAAPIEVLWGDTISTKLMDRASVLYEQKSQWELTCFDSGSWTIPPLQFIVNNDTVWTDMMELYVNTVPTDTTKPIKDIAGVIDVPPPPPPIDEGISPWWFYIGGAFLIGAALIFYFVRKRKTLEVAVPQQVGHVPLPHELLINKLNEMAVNKPWRNGNMKGHYTELTELMRGWVVERFHFSAMEMTTYQIMMRLRRMPDSGNKTSELEHVLRTADLVKFGKQTPDDYVNEKCIQHAIDFVMSTSFASVVHMPPPPTNFGQR